MAYHYYTRFTVVSLLTMLTFKTILKTLFIVDFDRMAAIPEEKVIRWMVVVTSLCTLAHLGEEAVIRNIHGLDHYSRQCYNIYLGNVVLNGIILLLIIALAGKHCRSDVE